MQALYKIPSFDASGNVVATEKILVNTDDTNQRQTWDWIGMNIRANGWVPQLIEIKYLNQTVVNRTITIQFKMPPEVPQTNLIYGLLGADSAHALMNPEATVVDLAAQVGVAIPISSLDYVDPDTPDTTPGVESDWEVQGAPIGPPFGPTFHQWYEWTDKANGYELNATFVGKSGKRYITINTPQAAKKWAGTPMIWQGQ
jgi:hypothetical protein